MCGIVTYIFMQMILEKHSEPHGINKVAPHFIQWAQPEAEVATRKWRGVRKDVWYCGMNIKRKHAEVLCERWREHYDDLRAPSLYQVWIRSSLLPSVRKRTSPKTYIYRLWVWDSIGREQVQRPMHIDYGCVWAHTEFVCHITTFKSPNVCINTDYTVKL